MNRHPSPYLDIPIVMSEKGKKDGLHGVIKTLCDSCGLYPVAIGVQPLSVGRSFEAAVLAALLGCRPGVRTGIVHHDHIEFLDLTGKI